MRYQIPNSSSWSENFISPPPLRSFLFLQQWSSKNAEQFYSHVSVWRLLVPAVPWVKFFFWGGGSFWSTENLVLLDGICDYIKRLLVMEKWDTGRRSGVTTPGRRVTWYCNTLAEWRDATRHVSCMPNFHAGCQQQQHKARFTHCFFLTSYIFSVFLLLFSFIVSLLSFLLHVLSI
jgi:hypothetical protein